MRLPRLPLAGAIGAAALVALPAPAVAAEAFYGVTTDNRLVTFQSDSPGRIRSSVPLTGLAPNEGAVAIDLRPATGQIHVLGDTNRVYVVTPASGAARALGEPFSPPLGGTAFGFDFNPVVDRIRVTSDGRQNLRLNPADGQVAAQDTQLAYADGDAGAGANPQVSAVAYTNNVAGATETKLFGIDAARDVLVLQNPPNDGKLNTIGPLGIDVGGPLGFDVATDGRAFVMAKQAGRPTAELFVADLATGRLAPAAARAAFQGADLRGIAAAGVVPDDTEAPVVVLNADRTRTRSALRRTLQLEVSCSEACGIDVRLRRGSRTLESATGTLDGAGRSGFRLAASDARKRYVKRRGRVSLNLLVTVTDAAGNTSTARRTLRFG